MSDRQLSTQSGLSNITNISLKFIHSGHSINPQHDADLFGITTIRNLVMQGIILTCYTCGITLWYEDIKCT